MLAMCALFCSFLLMCFTFVLYAIYPALVCDIYTRGHTPGYSAHNVNGTQPGCVAVPLTYAPYKGAKAPDSGIVLLTVRRGCVRVGMGLWLE